MILGPVGAELFHADRRTDMTKIIVAFRYFAIISGVIGYILHRNSSFSDLLNVSYVLGYF